ncbi:Glutathione import ATP-binding protein GsiA [Achromobacter deleyi]|uniref:Glutathione import ATP-binding protein GsiA n=1 Tax=Achromobacter deleyi TaxID=1353891 RepID=A0A6S7A5P0_9BURK|nr:ABC transporter ATP-binding protein [Achromobacter deleyi]CAB3707895.1 Glutathione import ATP-binding protein GsiA [Achromobacter deleyi]CAB3866004.1 Glutathione import ATP-binding protein GsiA [Achromobacter deleyi]CAB3878270.1 Glutathione import ATP-binding protein GsiA [Achromobacter deleyi]
MSHPVLEVRDLSVRLPGAGDRRHAAHGISLTVHPREIVCIVGESGSGKSVTASAVMGLLPRNVLTRESGQILLSGQDITQASPAELRALRGNRMAMIFQEPMTALNPLMRVGRQIAEIFQFHAPQLGAREVQARVLRLLADMRLPSPDTLQHAYPHQLSGGQRQRVMIAMALALEPALIIADEPTTALDVTSQAQVLRLLHGLRERHDTGILFITHDFDVVAEIADRVIVMQQGQIVETGTAQEVLEQPRHAYTRKLIDAVPKGEFGARRIPPANDPVISVENLQMRFVTGGLFRSHHREVHALNDVSLSLARGETLGVVGESGSGKTTLGRCLAHFAAPTGGRIVMNGQDVSRLSRTQWRQWCKRIQMVFQDPYRSFNPRRTIAQTLAEGPMNYGESPARVAERMREMLDLVSMDASALQRYPHEFSGGQRQRISIARALMMEPEVLIADEAVSALDVSVQAQILDLLEAIRERLNLSMIFITHDLRVAARLCHRIAVMQRGKVMEIGPAEQIFRHPSSDYTRELLAAIPGKDGLGSRQASIVLKEACA